MAWLDQFVELLASREWWLLMMIVIVAAAFMVPDYRMGEHDRKDRNIKEKED